MVEVKIRQEGERIQPGISLTRTPYSSVIHIRDENKITRIRITDSDATAEVNEAHD